MRHCPFFQEGGLANDCAEYCKGRQDTVSVNETALFEDDYELNKGCIHASLAIVAESVLWVANKAVAEYSVTYSCRDCGLEIPSQDSHNYPCDMVATQLD